MMRPRTPRLLLAVLVAASVMPVTRTAAARADRPAVVAATRVVVGVEPGRESAARAAIAQAGGRVAERGWKGHFLVAEVPAGQESNRFLTAVEDEPGVTYADVDRIVRPAFVPNDPLLAQQWYLSKIMAPAAWDITRGDPDVVVAVIDSGVETTHTDLAPNLDLTFARSFITSDPAGPAFMDPSNITDYVGHGTHVTGIVSAAQDNGVGGAGVSGACRVMPIRVLNTRGEGYESDVSQGIYWATDHGAHVINLSLGVSVYDSTMAKAVAYALENDVVVVAAAGNTGSGRPFYPAAYPGVIAVAATGASDARAAFSNYGSYVDIAAPGVEVTSTYLGSGYVALNGTSMASPVVAGVAALVRSACPTWTAGETYDAILGSVDDLGTAGRDSYFGYGRLNALHALTRVTADDTIPGVHLDGTAVSGRVNGNIDPHDVHSLSLLAGERLTAMVSGEGSNDVRLRVLLPDASSLSTAVPLTETTGTASSKTVSMMVPEDGDYVLDLSTGTTGGYTLSYVHGFPTKTSIGGPTTGRWAASVMLTGTATLEDGTPVSGGSVRIEARPYGGSWTVVHTTSTDASGTFQAAVVPVARTEYRATLPAQSRLLAATSGSHVVQPKAYLTTPSAPGSVLKGRYFVSAGYLKPRHTAGRRDVKLTCYRAENGRWRHYKSVYATNSNYGSYTRYGARLSLPYRGRWKIVASIAGDTTHLATTSGTRYLLVK